MPQIPNEKRTVDMNAADQRQLMREALLEVLPYTLPNEEMTYKKAQERFSVSKPTLLEWEKKGWLSASRVNGVRWSSHDIQRVLDTHRTKTQYQLRKAS